MAQWLAEEPALALPTFNQTALTVVLEAYPAYSMISDRVSISIDLPIQANAYRTISDEEYFE